MVRNELRTLRVVRRVGNLLPTRFAELKSKRCVTSYAPYGTLFLHSLPVFSDTDKGDAAIDIKIVALDRHFWAPSANTRELVASSVTASIALNMVYYS